MNVVSFCVYGDIPKYLIGAARNAASIPRLYPGFTARFYCNGVPGDLTDALLFHGADVRLFNRAEFSDPMLSRMQVMFEPGVERFLIRDCDSRVIEREIKAVRAWIESGMGFHSMRDHPAHCHPFNGGMWGGIPNAVPGCFRGSFERWKVYHPPGATDQTLLAEHLWPNVKHNTLQHDEFCRGQFPNALSFSKPTVGGYFVGEVINEYELPRLADRGSRYE